MLTRKQTSNKCSRTGSIRPAPAWSCSVEWWIHHRGVKMISYWTKKQDVSKKFHMARCRKKKKNFYEVVQVLKLLHVSHSSYCSTSSRQFMTIFGVSMLVVIVRTERNYLAYVCWWLIYASSQIALIETWCISIEAPCCLECGLGFMVQVVPVVMYNWNMMQQFLVLA